MKRAAKVLRKYEPIPVRKSKVINKQTVTEAVDIKLDIESYLLMPSKRIKPEPKPTSEPKRKEFCYRVAHRERGTGLYNSFPIMSPSIIADGGRHPSPYEDYGIKDIWGEMTYSEKDNYYFGFASLDQLRSWLHCQRYLKEIHDQGMCIFIYQTDDYHIGDTQMIFRKSTATLVGKADLI